MKWRLAIITIASVFGAAVTLFSSFVLHVSGTPEFCMSCHEMRVVGEQGWMRSPHYRNERGVVAECSDCHVPPELAHMVWVKSRDGFTDIYVHTFGETDPHRMDWDHLAETARGKIYDSSCLRCHRNLDDRGMSVSAIVAHRENALLERPKKCVACHRAEFHGGFRSYLENPSLSRGETK